MGNQAIKAWLERVREDEEELARQEVERVRQMSMAERIELIHKVLRAGMALWSANPNRERVQAMRDAEHEEMGEILQRVREEQK